MADKKTQRMAEFYEQCQAKGYTDMHDDKQSLKAKVIATDLKLNYGDIVAFYEKAKQAKAQIDREKAEEAERQRIQRQEKAKEDARRAINGELLVSISDSVRDSYGSNVIRVYIRPDGSIYSTLNNGDKIEGAPTVGAKTGGAMLLTYHPSQAVYTGATVGGVTTGGVHYTKEYYTHRTTSSAKGDVAARLGETEFTVAVITLSDYTAKLFKRDGAYKNLVYDGQIQCYNESSIAKTYVDAAFSGLGDYATSMNALSMAAEARRLPYDTCSSIANLLGRVVNGQFPPTDDQTYASATALASANDSATLKRAYETFESISDYKDAVQQAKIVKSKYDEVLQEEKEQAILEKEARKKATKKMAIVCAPVVAVIIAIVILITTVLIPNSKYNDAVALMDAGQYEEAIAAFEAMDGYNDSLAQIEACEIGILDGEYTNAVALMKSGQYGAAVAAFYALDGYRDSAAQIEACNIAILDGKYADAAALMANGQYEEAIAAFEAMDGYKDSEELAEQCFTKFWETLLTGEWIRFGGWSNPYFYSYFDVKSLTWTEYFESPMYSWECEYELTLLDETRIHIYGKNNGGYIEDFTLVLDGQKLIMSGSAVDSGLKRVSD